MIPFGYDGNETGFAISPHQAEAIRRVFDLYAAGQSIGAIVARFRDDTQGTSA